MQADYRGLSYFSAAQKSGLLVHPEIGCAHTSTQGRELHFDPRVAIATQRADFIHEIALREHALDPQGPSVADNERQLDKDLLDA
jgi:hypothetical protein